MKANKIFFDLYSPGKAEAEQIYYEKNDMVYICLMDLGIYTKVHRQEMFDTNMHHGCFIEHEPSMTEVGKKEKAFKLIHEYNLMYLPPEDFREAERSGEKERVKKAFAYAEKLIAES